MDRQEEFPTRQRNKIDDLVEEFLTNLGNDIHDMLCDQNEGDDYCGLDSDRDTEAKVETAIRLFPEVLSRRGGEYNNWFPIECLLYNTNYHCNLKAVSFVHVLATLAIEFGSFQENERGGLLVDDGDPLQHLASSSHSSYGEEQNRSVGNSFLAKMMRLRETGLLRKEDIQEYDLVWRLCEEDYFAENRFRFLVEWDPKSLLQTNNREWFPLHNVASNSSFQGFRSVFDSGIRYFPSKRGISLLFHKDYRDETPIQNSCKKFERNGVIDVVEETLARYSTATPINSTDALLLAAIDERIHLDVVYFVLRRQLDVLTRMLPPRLANNNNNNNNNSNITGDQDSTVVDNDDDDDDHDDDDIVNPDYDADGNNDSKKRKRKGWN